MDIWLIVIILPIVLLIGYILSKPFTASEDQNSPDRVDPDALAEEENGAPHHDL